MKILPLLIIASAAWGGSKMLYSYHSGHVAHAALANSNANGFVDVPSPAGMDRDTVYVVAAQNCPHEAAQRADQLAKALIADGVPVQRTNEVSFNPQSIDRNEMTHLSSVMGSPLPLVFIHGRVASNPALGQVVEEYSHVGSTQAKL